MPKRKAREQAREGTADMLMSRSSAVRARLGNNSKVSIDYIEASGDCFYLAMEAALCEQEGVSWCPFYAVSAQREVVATSLTEEIFRLYSMLHAEKADGFQFMSGVDSLDALRTRIRLRGQKVGAKKCVWADGFAMETIANHYQLLLLVVDERSSSLFTRITPRRLEGVSQDGSMGGSQDLDAKQLTVLLHASTREHMNLIRYDGRKLFALGDLPPEILRCWGICVTPNISPVQARPDLRVVLSTLSASSLPHFNPSPPHNVHTSFRTRTLRPCIAAHPLSLPPRPGGCDTA